MAKSMVYQNILSKIIMSLSIERTLTSYDQPIDSDIKRLKAIRKLTTGQDQDYTTGCLLDYEYVKNNYRLIAIDFSRQKELDAVSKAIQQIEFFGQLKNDDVENADGTRFMFVLTILEKIKKTRLKFSQGSVTVLWKIANYKEERFKLTKTQLNKLRSAAKYKTGTTLRITKKNFQDEESAHELFLTTRHKTKIRNAFADHMSKWYKT